MYNRPATQTSIFSMQHISFITHIPTPEPSEPKPILQVSKYLLNHKIGSGSYSKVYSAKCTEDNQIYAVKIVKFSDLIRIPDGVEQLEREIKIMRELEHQNIVKLFEVLMSKSKKRVYLVMDYAEKGSVAQIARKENLSIEAISSIMKQICMALSYLHSKGYVHQDIKPANILMNNKGRALLGDFGIGHSFRSASMVMGSPAFQAPEALKDDEDENDDSIDCPQIKEDIWALGVSLYQMLFKKLPYVGCNLYEIVENIKEKELKIPKCNFEVPEKLIRGMLETDPQKRYSLKQILDDPFIKNADDIAKDLVVCDNNNEDFNNEKNKKDRKIKVDEVIKCEEGYSFIKIGEELKEQKRKAKASSFKMRFNNYYSDSKFSSNSLPTLMRGQYCYEPRKTIPYIEHGIMKNSF